MDNSKSDNIQKKSGIQPDGGFVIDDSFPDTYSLEMIAKVADRPKLQDADIATPPED